MLIYIYSNVIYYNILREIKTLSWAPKIVSHRQVPPTEQH